MPRKKTNPNQDPMFEAPTALSPIAQMDRGRKITFGRVVMPYFGGIDPTKYHDITPAMVRAADPEKLYPYLITRSGKFVVDGVALSSDEYGRIPRSVSSLRTSTSNESYKKARLDTNAEHRHATAARAGQHALESRLGAIQGSLNGIRYEQTAVQGLRKQARHPGYAHETLGTMKEWHTTTTLFTFPRMLEVVGREKEWTSEQADLAKRAIDVRLYLSGNERVGNWRGMLDVADEYGIQREELFTGREVRIIHILGAEAAAQTVQQSAS